MVAFKGEQPLYSLAQVKRLVRTGAFQLVTWKAVRDYGALGFSTKQFAAVVDGLMASHFCGVQPECQASVGLAMDCDSYSIEIDRELLVPRRGGSTHLYLKFAIAPSGRLVAFFSCHD